MDDDGPWGSNRPGRKPQLPKPPANQNDLDEMLRAGQDKFRDFMSGGAGSPKGIILLLIIGLLAWLITGIFFVEPDEQGVVMRFGEFHRLATPGPRYRLPSPIESVAIIKVTRVNRVEIGYRSDSGSFNDERKVTPIENESLMLTGDENIIDINLEVEWVVKDAKNFVFNIKYPDIYIRQASESAIREVVGRTAITAIQTDKRVMVEAEARDLLQAILDNYQAGVEVLRFKILKAAAPPEVMDAFRDVQTAQSDKDRIINEADVYSNDIIPRAKGDAERIIQDSLAYKQQVVARALGEASRFNAIYEEYRKAEDVTRRRIYLETMEDILKGMNKVIIEPGAGGSGGAVPIVTLNDLLRKKEEPK